MAHWVEQYLGRPYVAGGCWHLFKDVQRERFSRMVDVATVPDDLRGQIRAFEQGSKRLRWREVKQPIDGDGVLMTLSRQPHHVGTYVEINGVPRVLHSLEGQGVGCPSLAALQQLAGFNVIGFYRPEDEIVVYIKGQQPDDIVKAMSR